MIGHQADTEPRRSVQHIGDEKRPGKTLCGIDMPPLPFGPVEVHVECWRVWRERRRAGQVEPRPFD